MVQFYTENILESKGFHRVSEDFWLKKEDGKI